MGTEWPEKPKRSEASPEKRKRSEAQTGPAAEQALGAVSEWLGQIPLAQRSQLGGIFALIVFLTFFAFALSTRGSVCPGFFMVLFCAIIPTLMAAGVFAWWWMGKRHFGPVTLTLSADEVRRGDVLQVHYQQGARSRITIPGYSLRMILRETVRYRRGTDTVTEHYDHVVHQVNFDGRSLAVGDELAEDVEFEIPAGAMHSFDETDNKLRWYVVAEVRLNAWPHRVKHETGFTVLAEGRRS